LTLVASIGLPLVPQLISIALVRRTWRSRHTHIFSLAAAGMVQVLSGMWLLKAFSKVPLFFDAPTSEAFLAWQTVTLDSAPYMASSLSMLAGGFWLALAWSQRTPKSSTMPNGPAVAVNLDAVIGADSPFTGMPTVVVNPEAKNRQTRRREKRDAMRSKKRQH
jgi:hypothetical protein